MDKIRISDIALELGIKSKEVIEKANELSIEAKVAKSAITEEEAEILANYILTGKKTEIKSKQTTSAKETKKSKESTKPKEKSAPKEVKKEAPKTTKRKSDTKTQKHEPKKESIKNSKTKSESKEKSEQKKPETLAQASLKKRRGIIRVIKKKNVTPQKQDNIVNKDVSEELSKFAKGVSPQPAPVSSKKKKKVKKVESKKEKVKTLDIAANMQMGESNNFEDEVVVLPDWSVDTKDENVKKTKRKNNPNEIKATRHNTFLNQTIQRTIKKRRRKPQGSKTPQETSSVESIEIPEDIRVYEFAEKINKQPSDIIKALFTLGVMVTKNDFLDKDAIEILAEEFNMEVKTVNLQDDFDYIKEYDDIASQSENLVERAPVVTIMGHVDHGKTSLLDKIRSTKVTEREHGGITQHVGAYMVNKNGKNITFIDTPGHEAFTEMRSRGAQVTDIVVIVVAADDGVKPQTVEAIDHAKAAKVPMIIAINKIDKPDANPDLVKSGLAEHGITPIDWGGEYEFVEVSAKSGEGIDSLLEVILLQAEIMELKANPDLFGKAVIIESSLQKGRGPITTVIVQNGTLRVGNTVVAGIAYGKIKALLDDSGKNIEAIHPGEPGVVVGLNEVPESGETMVRVATDKKAREYAQKRYEYLRQKELSKSTKATLEELSSLIAEGQLKTLPIILKADVAGSLEAIKNSLEKLKNEETKVQIIHSGVGGITESDITLAEASENCIILGFHIRPTGSVKEKAKKSGIEIKTYNVIYDLIDDVKAILSGMMSPIIKEESVGQAEVRDIFSVPKIGTIAGCLVTDGVINRGIKVRVIRDGVIIYESTVSSLKRFKDDVKEVAKGYECGIGIEGFNDIKVGDFIESYKEVEEKVQL
jgi:translation initiation factor IF-2